ncbi:MAG: DUF6198 family protein [Planctomycetes bacterium]|nr:DUF6198 family protein [Planctomycetota bacterium]
MKPESLEPSGQSPRRPDGSDAITHDTDTYPAVPPADLIGTAVSDGEASIVDTAVTISEGYFESAAASGRGLYVARRSRKEWLVRLALMLTGLGFAQIGTTLVILIAIGSDPYTVFVQGLATVFGFTIGVTHLAFTSLLFIFFAVFARSYILPGTFVGTFFAGPIIDLYTWLIGDIVTADLALAVRLALSVTSCVIVGIGLALIIRSDGGMGANDLLSVYTADKLRVQYRWVKVSYDSLFVITGFLLGGVVGVGTVLSVFLVGPVAQYFFPTMDRLVGGVLVRTGCAAK